MKNSVTLFKHSKHNEDIQIVDELQIYLRSCSEDNATFYTQLNLTNFEKPDKIKEREKFTRVWTLFLNDLQRIEEQYEAVEMLSENSCMISLKKSTLAALHDVIHAAYQRDLNYKLLFFEKKPQWVYSSKTS